MEAIALTNHDLAIEDIEYLRHGDMPLLLRLFQPSGAGPFPLIVELHGGAWAAATAPMIPRSMKLWRKAVW